MPRGSGGPIKGPIKGPPPVGRPARSGRETALLAASATFSVFVIGALIAGWIVVFGPGPQARSGEATIVTIPSGAGVSVIAARLRSDGVIRSADLFKATAALTGQGRRLRAGEYEVPSGASLNDVLSLLVDGRVVRHFVTIPEGWSSTQAVDILNDNAVLTGAIETVPEEGSLWPETYEVTRGETRQAVIARMQRAQQQALEELWATRGPLSVVQSPEEAVILASIVEKETAVAAERPQVASVFSNRIRQGMRLESDPTIVYGITRGRPLGRGIRRSEIQADTGYNTYLISGLPPTPIANPGRESIAAVLNPPRSDYLFFVADGTGGHAFARTYAEHLLNVARWREIERRRAGLAPGATPAVPEAVPPGEAPTEAPSEGGQAVITLPSTPQSGARVIAVPTS